MTDTSENSPAPQIRPELRSWCEAWRTCLQNVLAQVSGQPAAFDLSAEPLPFAASDLWYTVVAGGAARGEMTLRLPAPSGTLLAQKFLNETEPAPEGITPEHKEALEELLCQIAGLAATAVAATAGGEVQLRLSSSAAPSWSSDTILCLQTRDEAGTPIALEIQISPALAAALQPRVPAAIAPQALPPSASSAQLPAASYRRLLDIGLDVKLRFGTRRMLLRDVLALSPGVVVELDNALHSPVDLLLDGRLIAQGEVVVVDGAYGLRVTDIVDPAQTPGFPA